MKAVLLFAVLLGFVAGVNVLSALYEHMVTISPTTAMAAYVAGLVAEVVVGVCLLVDIVVRL